MKSISERLEIYRQRIDMDLALIRDAQAWIAERYQKVQVKNLKGDVISESYPPDVLKMRKDLDDQESAIKMMVAEGLGLTLEQAEGGE